jgi:hypothetical protein
MMKDRVPPAIALAAGLFSAGLGLWAFFDPQSFFDQLALFPPYNEHLLHDVGAFQVGLGATLLLALVWRSDALLVALAGMGIGAVLHFISHVEDTDLGGRSSDPYTLGVLAAVIVGAAAWRWAAGRER